MTKDKDNEIIARLREQRVDLTSRSYVGDQRVELTSTGGDVRKGVNVLNTSDPKNPAPNPFVQNQNQGGQGGQQNTGNQPSSGNSDKK
jgi:hypothetical protein